MVRYRAFAVASALALLPSTAVLAHDHAVLRGRLIFSDFEKSVVRVLDLDTGEVTHTFDVPKPRAGFATVEGGRYVVIKTGDDAGTLKILDTGLVIDEHGDHNDIEKNPVKMLNLAFTGDKPAHVVSENGWLALFYDGQRPWDRKSDPKAVLIETKTLSSKKPNIDTWQSPAPQHGIAIPLGRKQWLLSVPNPAYAKGGDRSASSRPNGFEIVERGKDWKVVASFNDASKAEASCALFHGHASLNNVHAFGCKEGDDGGVLVVERAKSGKWNARSIKYPDERRTSTLKAREGGRYMVGNYGLKAPYDALLRVDPKAKTLADKDVLAVPGGQSACQFELSSNGKRVANLTPDGKLRVYDLVPDWKEVASFDAVAAFDCAYDARTPAPSLAVIGNSAFVSDPANARIREFHLDGLKQGLDMPVGGVPANIAGGGSGG